MALALGGGSLGVLAAWALLDRGGRFTDLFYCGRVRGTLRPINLRLLGRSRCASCARVAAASRERTAFFRLG
ncbi:MAG: hypothetical protein ACP5NI_04700 [Acetobacteraceae bacterium]